MFHGSNLHVHEAGAARGAPARRATSILQPLLALALAGCGSAEPEVPLCDGSDGLTLRIFADGESNGVTGGTVRVENGYPSFAVDGQCRYFISGGWRGTERQGRDEGWRQGTVDADLRRTLESVGGWKDMSGRDDCESYSTLPDAPTLVVANTHSALVCPGGQGRRVGSMFEVINERASKLRMQAQALDQDLHVVAVQDYVADGEPFPRYDWPGEAPLRDYVLDHEVLSDRGQSTCVDAADAGPLREIRERFLLAGRARYTGIIGGIQMSDGVTSAAVYLRDALPYEDERGLWPRLPEE